MSSVEVSSYFFPEKTTYGSLTENRDRGKEKTGFLLSLMVLTNILFPKAGIKIGGDIPLTVGNIVVILMLACQGVRMVLRGKIRFSAIDGAIVIEIVYWFFRLGITALNNPNISSGGMSDMFVAFVVLVVYPFVFWTTKSLIGSIGQIEKILWLIRACLFLVMGYAVIQLFFGIEQTAIPGLTVNYSDYIENPTNWWNYKSNAYVVGSKMVSTYQNGNNLGVAMMLLYPITFRIPTRKKIFKIISFILFTVVIFLTGSRAAMLGYVFYVLLLVISAIKNNRVSLKNFILGLTAALFMLGVFVWLLGTSEIAPALNRLVSSLSWDVILAGGGRTEQALKYFSWLFDRNNSHSFEAAIFGGLGLPYNGGAYEMTYVYVFILGGMIGLVLFLVPFCFVISKSTRKMRNGSRWKWVSQGLVEGIVAYGFTAFMEGAYFVPPAAINIWFTLALLDRMTKYTSMYGAKNILLRSS